MNDWLFVMSNLFYIVRRFTLRKNRLWRYETVFEFAHLLNAFLPLTISLGIVIGHAPLSSFPVDCPAVVSATNARNSSSFGFFIRQGAASGLLESGKPQPSPLEKTAITVLLHPFFAVARPIGLSILGTFAIANSYKVQIDHSRAPPQATT